MCLAKLLPHSKIPPDHVFLAWKVIQEISSPAWLWRSVEDFTWTSSPYMGTLLPKDWWMSAETSTADLRSRNYMIQYTPLLRTAPNTASKLRDSYPPGFHSYTTKSAADSCVQHLSAGLSWGTLSLFATPVLVRGVSTIGEGYIGSSLANVVVSQELFIPSDPSAIDPSIPPATKLFT